MADLLYRLGRWSYRRRWWVVGLWAALVLLATGGAVLGAGRTEDSFSVPGTESQRALAELRRDLPDAAGAGLTLVVRAPAGQALDGAESKAATAELAGRAARLPGVVAVADPHESGRIDRTRTVGLIDVRYAHSLPELTEAERDAFKALADAGTSGLEVLAGGLPAAAPRIGVPALAGAGIAALLLVVVGSVVAAGTTLLAALGGAGLGLAAVFLAARVAGVSSVTPALVLMLGLATGTTYAVLVASRQRELLREGMPVGESIATASATAGPAVLTAGAIVIVALGGLCVLRVPFLTVIGLLAAGTVALAALAALTLLPALLGLSTSSGGERPGGAHERQEGGRRWAAGVARFRIPLVIGLVLGLVALTAPARDLRLALPDNGSAPAGSPQRRAYDAITAAFGAGANGQLLVVVRGPRGDVVSGLAGRVTAGVRKLRDVATAEGGASDAAGTTRVLIVTPVTGPGSARTADLVAAIRRVSGPLAEGTGSIAVTGTTAVGVDVSRKMTAALPEYLVLVLGVSFVLLLLAFRSVVLPLQAAAGFLLTTGATLGLTAGVSGGGTLTSFLPTVLVGVLFGLAMSFDVSLVTRIRAELARGRDATGATIAGVGRQARVLAVAGLVLAAVFGAFVLAGDPTVRAIGFGLAVGVLVDVFLVRLILVPATLAMLGDRAWRAPAGLRRRRGRHVARRRTALVRA